MASHVSGSHPLAATSEAVLTVLACNPCPCLCCAACRVCPQVYTVTLHGEQLKTDFRVINTDDKAFEFTTALHTYIEVLDVNTAKVSHTQVGTAT